VGLGAGHDDGNLLYDGEDMSVSQWEERKKEEKGKIRNGMWEFDGTHSPQAIQVSVKPNPPKRSKHFEHPSILHAISLLFVSLIV
jgi:hypothetical protein